MRSDTALRSAARHRPHAPAHFLKRLTNGPALLRYCQFWKRSLDGNNFCAKLFEHGLGTAASQVAEPFCSQST